MWIQKLIPVHPGERMYRMMKKLILTIVFTAFLTGFAYGQTTLAEGDIAIIGLDTPGEDFSFVTFINIEENTEIYFTDEEAAGNYSIGTGEGTVLFSAPAGGITAGTVITYQGNSAYFTTTSDGVMALGNSGDGLLAYQGSSVGNVSVFLHAVGEDSGDIGTFPDGFSNYMTFGADDGEYDGTRTGTAAELLAAINNSSNWTTSGSGVIPFNTTSFTVSGGSSAPDDPTSFTATTASASQISLSWTQNGDTDDVLIVYDTDGSFTDPVDGTSYSVSSSALGGTVIYNGSGTSYDHTSLSGGTHYYYKAWSVDGDDNYSTGVTDDASTIKAEPTNHPSSFAGSSDHNSITLTWSDNDGSVVADGFLIKASSTSLESISPVSDGTAVADDTDWSDNLAAMNISHGTETCEFIGLDAETTYYFTIWAYTNSGSNIDYRTERPLVTVSKATTAEPEIPQIFISEMCDPSSDYTTNRYIEIYNAGTSSVDLSGWKVVAIINDGSTEAFTWNLSGSIASGDALVCGDDGNTLITPDFAETDWSSSNSSWNGKTGDGAKLYDGTTLIDDAGSHGNFENKTTQRNASVTEPTTTFSSSEWTSTSTTNYENATPGSHTCDEPSGGSAPDDPTSFTATTASASQISLSWTQNGDTDDVLVVYDADGSFTDPVDGTSYSVSSSALGGTVIYNGSGTSYDHTSLSGATHYYYKAWSVDGDDNYSTGVTDDATTIKAEASNHASSFSSTSDHNSIDLTWSDNDGAVAADGFLVKASSTSLGAISAPSDGTAESDDSDLSDGSAVVNVTHGTETYEFSGLDAETTYYFKIWPFTNSASNIDYKTDATVPSLSKATTAVPPTPDVFISEVADPSDVANAKFVELYNANGSSVNLSSGNWYLTIQANGANYTNIALSGTVDNNSTFVIANNSTDFENEFTGKTADQYNGSIQGNGDDAYFLYYGGDQSSGILVDIYGAVDTDGTGEDWEYTDGHAVRNANISEPNTTWTSSEWTITPGGTSICTPGEHTLSGDIVGSPTGFTATAASTSQINLAWTQNDSSDNVLIVFDTDNSFTDPVDGSTYSVSSSAMGGIVIYNGSGTSYNHSSLSGATKYYYQAWSVDGSNNYSAAVLDSATTIKAEASNHASSFSSTSDHNSIDLTWSDNDGAVAADGFLVKASSTSLGAISAPSDGTAESDDSDLSDGSAVVNVTHGTETYEFSGLDAETTYYFKIWPFTNSASNIDYKTDATVPSLSKATTEAPAPGVVFISEVSDPGDVANAKFVELYNSGGSSVDLSAGSWYIGRQANGGTWADIALTGTIAAGGTYVIAYNQSTFETEFTPTTADQYSGSISGNGDDGYFLYSGGDHSSGTLVDAYGVIDQDGTDKDWEYLDAVATRKSNISAPNTTWTSSEWIITDPGNVADCTPAAHTVSAPTVDAPTSFTATAASASQINLSWTLNGNSDTVLVVYDEDGSFTDPVDGTDYAVSSSSLGGTVIYKGIGTSYNHTSLSGGTTYYYKAWSLDASADYSNAVSDDESTVKAEPTNHVASFSAVSNHSSVTLTWSDNDGAVPADAFLIKASTTSLAAIADPVDATAASDDTDLSDGSGAVNVPHGTETYNWAGLNPSTTYYFKIFPYTNSGSNIDYKSDGLVPSGSQSTSAPVIIIISEMMINPDAVDDANGEWFEIYNAGTETVNIDGWTISDDGSDSHTIDNGGTLNIAAGAFLVLGNDTSSSTNGDYDCDYQYGNFSLANGGDEIIIKDGSTLIDSVGYDDGTNWPISAGASTVFVGESEDDNSLYGNWGVATQRQNRYRGDTGDKGSPGTNGNDQALPVTLGSFTARYSNGKIELTWITESETDNARFLVYRDDELIASLQGAGTTSDPNEYHMTDPFVIPGVSYTYTLADISYANIETIHTDRAITITAGEEGIETDFSIGSAFPNPFNPSTLIPINLAGNKYVNATLYDMTGRKIKTLLDQNMNAGSHELYIDGYDLATGVYIVRILVEDQLRVQKIALMK